MNFDSLIVASDFEYPTVAVWDTRVEAHPIRELQLGVSLAQTDLFNAKATCVQYSEVSNDQ
ncbi:hypothetical protein A2U01_0101952, partial [Trifolium medium]|nr:hypothetical protein [Trifolium medium]